jgi:pimeloyl-ACP methyl ester carboxylesterase
VFQHGLCGDAGQTFEAAPDLSGWQVLTLECAGHGQSDASPPFSIARFADDVTVLIESLRRPVVLGGISMGAAIASRIAVQRPDLVTALVLVRPAWIVADAPENMQANAEVGRYLSAGAGSGAFQASPIAHHLAQVAPDNLASLLGFFDRKPLAVTAALLTAIAQDGPGITPADLAALRIPVMVCGTVEDVVHPLALAQTLATQIPAATFTELPPKGRNKPAHIAALQAAIRAFLQDI